MRDTRYMRPNTANSRPKKKSSSSDEVAPPSSTMTNSVADQQLVKRELKVVKKVAAALATEAWVVSFLASVKDHVQSMLHLWTQGASTSLGAESSNSEGALPKAISHSKVVCLRLVGLGIGTFTCGACSSALLQMGLFIVVKTLLTGLVEKCVQLELPVRTTAECFDPVASACDKEVCQELGITMPTQNHYGAYEVVDTVAEASLLVAFMPHCSATLYHNLFVANWPQQPHASDTTPMSSPWERILLIGNDLSRYVSNPQVARNRKNCITSLLPAMVIEPCFHDKSRSRKLDGGIGGVTSYSDVERAFSDLTIVSVRSSSDIATAVADQGRGSFKVVKDGLDIL